MAERACGGALAGTPVCVPGRVAHWRRSAAGRDRKPRPFAALEALWRRAVVHRHQGVGRPVAAYRVAALRRGAADRRVGADIHPQAVEVAARSRCRVAAEVVPLRTTT